MFLGGLESISPIFRVHEKSAWRSHLEIFWRFIETDYNVSVNASCGTHVHLSRVGGYSLTDLKKICQCVIHFETAFEALVPENRLGNEYARSNWLDNTNFAYKNLSRRQTIERIEDTSTINELVLLMNPNENKFFGWNFLYLLNNPNRTIEFRRGSGCTSAQQAFVWIEIAMSFIEAAVQLKSRRHLERMPGTVGGLKSFIKAANLTYNVPGLYNFRYLSLF